MKNIGFILRRWDIHEMEYMCASSHVKVIEMEFATKEGKSKVLDILAHSSHSLNISQNK